MGSRLTSLAILIATTLAVSSCSVFPPKVTELPGVWVASGPGVTSTLTLSEDGSFTVRAIPASALGSVPRKLDWATLVDTTGDWSYGDNANEVYMHFLKTETTGGYFGPARLTVGPGGSELDLLVSADRDIYLEYSKVEK